MSLVHVVDFLFRFTLDVVDPVRAASDRILSESRRVWVDEPLAFREWVDLSIREIVHEFAVVRLVVPVVVPTLAVAHAESE